MHEETTNEMLTNVYRIVNKHEQTLEERGIPEGCGVG